MTLGVAVIGPYKPPYTSGLCPNSYEIRKHAMVNSFCFKHHCSTEDGQQLIRTRLVFDLTLDRGATPSLCSSLSTPLAISERGPSTCLRPGPPPGRVFISSI